MKHLQSVVSLFAAALVLTSSGVAYAVSRTQSTLTFDYDRTNVSVTSPLKVSFSQDIDPSVYATLDQPVPGRWERVSGPFGLKGINFHPRSRLEAGKTYKLILSNLKRSFTGELVSPKKVIEFTTETPPTIQSFSPTDKASQVLTTSSLQLVLRSQNHALRRLHLTIEPAIPTQMIAHPDDQTFQWKFPKPLAQGTTYQIAVDDLNISDPGRRRLVITSFTTVTEPVPNGTQRGYFLPGDAITIDFDQPMRAATTSFKFDAAGAGRWTSPTRYEYLPTGLRPGATYSYTVIKGATSLAGGVTTADRTFHISTPGPVTVTGMGPGGSAVSRSAAIKFTFDQAVDRASAQARFSLSPGLAGSFSWSGNTLIFSPSSALDFQATYAASIGPGVQPVFGLPSTHTFTTTFTTEVQVTRLGVPFFYQPYSLSCEETDLRMVLAYRGINTSESDIVSRVGYNPRARDTINNFWDNPYDMFVGDIVGKQNSTGYGVYAAPIAAAARSYGRDAVAQTNVSAATIAANIRAGHPVIFWGSSITPKLDSWNTPSGPVQAWIGEHTRVVVGVVGRTEAPIAFYVHDSVYGANLYWTAAHLTANLNSVGSLSNQIVVVY